MTLVPLSNLILSKRPVRPVMRESLEFYELKDAMETQGLLVPLLVRGNEIVDGNSRFVAAGLLGWSEIDITMREMSNKEVLIAQIRLNDLGVKDARVAISQLINDYSLDKVPKIGYSLGRNVDWVSRILGLDELAPVVRKSVDLGLIDAKAAMLLAKLPKGRQKELLRDSLDSDFVLRLQSIVRKQYEGKLNRRIVKKNTGPYLRSEREIYNELDNPLHAMRLITREQVTTPFDAWQLALSWALRLDFESFEERKMNE